MKKSIRSLLAVSCFSFLLAACDNHSNQNPDNANSTQSQEIRTLIIGLDDSFPPMGFRDKNNEIVGFDIDMAKEVGKRINAKIELKPIDWSSKEAELESHRVDMLWNGLTITDYRKNKILFSEPYMTNHQIVIVNNDCLIQTKADLSGKKIGVQEGSSAFDAINSDPIHEQFAAINTYPDNVTALIDLQNNRVDAVVVDEVVGRYYLDKKTNSYSVLNDNFGEEHYGVGFRTSDNELQQNVQKALNEMKSDGTSAKISNQWFGKDVTQ